MCKIHLTANLLGIALLCFAFSTETQAETAITRYYVYFDSDKYDLKDSACQTISDLAKNLPKTGTVSISVSGNTDADGTDNYNVSLSEKRTSVVMEALISNGVAPDLISRAHFGERKPTDQNSNENGKAKNRRVEITVRHVIITSLSDLIQSEASLTPETFNLKTNERNVITGKKGIQLTIPENAFADSCGNPINAKNVSVVLTEFMSVEDAFFHGVTSMSDKGLLESGGMFNVEAFAGNNPLQLKDGKTINVRIPAEKTVNDMKLYTAIKDSIGNMVWTEMPQQFIPGSVPVDTKRITLSREKYAALLNEGIAVKFTDYKIDTLMAFNKTEPRRPYRPRYGETKLLTMKEAFNVEEKILMSKQERAVKLEQKNSNITEQNENRLERYEDKRERYLRDSASYNDRLQAFKDQQTAYALYVIKHSEKLEKLEDRYQQYLIRNRLKLFLKKALSQSDSGKLYNSDLFYRAYMFSTSDSKTLRDFEFENLLVLQKHKCKVYLGEKDNAMNIYYTESFVSPGKSADNKDFFAVLEDEKIKKAFLQIIDDNPHLVRSLKENQKRQIENGLVVQAYYTPPAKSFYEATIGQLGYVNCDRLRQGDILVSLELEQANKKAQTYAFIKNVNASQQIYGKSAQFKKGEQIKMLSVYFEEGKPFVATNEVRLNDSKKVALKYQEMKPEEFKQMVLNFI